MRTKSIFVLTIVFLFNGNVSFANDRTPFCKSLTVSPDTNKVILTVSEDEQFVLLKLYAYCDGLEDWHLDVDNEILLAGTISLERFTSSGIDTTYVHDFPDSCVVVPAGKTLNAINENTGGHVLKLTLIGYFEEIDIGLVSDLNDDHKVNFWDFALLANEWLATSP